MPCHYEGRAASYGPRKLSEIGPNTRALGVIICIAWLQGMIYADSTPGGFLPRSSQAACYGRGGIIGRLRQADEVIGVLFRRFFELKSIIMSS